MPKMTPGEEAAYALDFNLSRNDLKPAVQAEYDRLSKARQQAAYALGTGMSRDDLKPAVQAEYDRLMMARRVREPKPESGMTVDAQGTVTIWQPEGTVLRADDHGVTVRRPLASPRRVAWAEISRLEDGGGYDSQNGLYIWKLVIVLGTGEKVGAYPMYGAPPPETVAAIRQIAERHEIPADVAGIPMKNGRPVRRGFYGDPGGQAGLRYWDGRQWSPLLPPGIVRPGRVTLQDSPASWSALPAAGGRWRYAAVRAARRTVWAVISAAVAVALLAGGLVAELSRNHGAYPRHTGAAWLAFAAIAAVFASIAWESRAAFRKLDQAANGSGVPVHSDDSAAH